MCTISILYKHNTKSVHVHILTVNTDLPLAVVVGREAGGVPKSTAGLGNRSGPIVVLGEDQGKSEESVIKKQLTHGFI